jgi:hypothetical protein
MSADRPGSPVDATSDQPRSPSEEPTLTADSHVSVPSRIGSYRILQAAFGFEPARNRGEVDA